jgi:hypothetical protein
MLAQSLRRQADRDAKPKLQPRAIRADPNHIKLHARGGRTAADFQPFIQ